MPNEIGLLNFAHIIICLIKQSGKVYKISKIAYVFIYLFIYYEIVHKVGYSKNKSKCKLQLIHTHAQNRSPTLKMLSQ